MQTIHCRVLKILLRAAEFKPVNQVGNVPNHASLDYFNNLCNQLYCA
jgi:hypothetical protein